MDERKKILVVDDNAKNRKLLRVILQKAGYDVVEAGNGREGVEAAIDFRPHLILMDYRMPVLNGIEATKEIKSTGFFETTPVFIVTSSAMLSDRERIVSESGCDAFFTKPIDYQAILAEIKKALGARA